MSGRIIFAEVGEIFGLHLHQPADPSHICTEGLKSRSDMGDLLVEIVVSTLPAHFQRCEYSPIGSYEPGRLSTLTSVAPSSTPDDMPQPTFQSAAISSSILVFDSVITVCDNAKKTCPFSSLKLRNGSFSASQIQERHRKPMLKCSQPSSTFAMKQKRCFTSFMF